jgi:hypothetical protein
MEIDNQPSIEGTLLGNFEKFSKQRLETMWRRVIGNKSEVTRTKQTKINGESTLFIRRDVSDVKMWSELKDQDRLIISWNEEGRFKRLVVTKNTLVGTEKMSDGQEAVVIKSEKRDSLGDLKETIRKFYINDRRQ